MKTILVVGLVSSLLLGSCVSSKKYNELTSKNKNVEARLSKCVIDMNVLQASMNVLQASNTELRAQIGTLNSTNKSLLDNIGNLSNLSTEGAKNLEKTLESIHEKDLEIRYMRDAINKKDSITLALVTSIKGVLGNLDDDDIEISVEKGVVFVSISDKLLFTSGSYAININAKPLLKKIAKVLNDKPSIEFMVEGHTDSKPINKTGIADNWDLSVLRAASVVRIFQNEFKIAPERMTAAGRSYYLPISDNNSAEGRSRNRRTRIVILPKLDQFFSMVEEGEKKAIENQTNDGK